MEVTRWLGLANTPEEWGAENLWKSQNYFFERKMFFIGSVLQLWAPLFPLMGFHELLALKLYRGTQLGTSPGTTRIFSTACVVKLVREESQQGCQQPQHPLKTKPTDMSVSKESCLWLIITLDWPSNVLFTALQRGRGVYVDWAPFAICLARAWFVGELFDTNHIILLI